MELLKSVRLLSNVLFYRFKWGHPGEVDRHWENYWRSIGKTGKGGEVLWDNEPERASAEDLPRFRPHLDLSLPLLDFGCGNGRQTRFLAKHFDRVLATDVSPTAIEKARAETPTDLKIEFRLLDALKPAQAKAFHDEFGDVNIYMRTVMHVVQKPDRPRFVETLSTLLGKRGTLYQIELSLCALDYFRTLPGSSPSGLPSHVHNVIRTGATSVGFDPKERFTLYPESRFEVLAGGEDVTINTVTLGHGEEGLVPANYLIVRNRNGHNGHNGQRA
ncbi:MAG TPA: class I SAM-dependent methyltransferase [Thermoanaerobaculia bacterium]|jgi:SAM-dependent methyltransferase|nr:class I SAM-dependent methyltransferase [Thermoanaerobaculia bacterium]